MNLNMIYLHLLVFVASLMTPSSGSAIMSQPASHLMIDFNWSEPDFKIKLFPHEKYCHYFYKWEDDDIFTIRKCPKGQIFDFHSHECKEKKEAKCWSHLYGKTKVHDHIHSKLKKVNFICPFSSGKYPDVVYCEKYFVCRDGIPHQKHCPPTKLFDRIRRQCVAEIVALCADITDAEDIHHRCPKPSGTFGHPKDCSKYYTCKHGEPSLKECPKDELFNEVEKYCTNNEVHCGNRLVPNNEENTFDRNPEASKNSPSSEPVRNVSKSMAGKTNSNLSKSESLLSTTSIAMQTTSSEIKESSSLASKDLKNGDVKITRMSEKLSTSNDTAMFSTPVSTSISTTRL